ncbi:type 2 lanthipeptide synthetase LanM [Iningainema tapete]|uniref:type 2 lanthipeptide synthetase LanM n=1 Tax=Iningainema tapete TaxID=2806730 RepID=UPI00192DD509
MINQHFRSNFNLESQTGKTLGFLYAIMPQLLVGEEQLHHGIEALKQKHSHLPFDSKVESLLFANLPSELLGMLLPTMVLELNVARLRGLLSGVSPQERFTSFVKQLQNPEVAIALLQEYPVLAQQVVLYINQWVAATLEFLERLCTDWEKICTTFSQEQPGILVQVWNTGDRHCGGTSVSIAKFSSGFQVVYKPKPLAVDIHFQQLLTWLNQKGNHPQFQTVKILNKGNYGWVEFITPSSCTSSAQIQRFYQRLGGYLAVLYALEATDFHQENIIAAGEHPIPIDLETLFHPRLVTPNSPESIFVTHQVLANSVMRVGLLPQRQWVRGADEGIDMSGISTVTEQMIPKGILSASKVGTDEMQITRKHKSMPKSQNRPHLNNLEVNALEYQQAIISGFTNIYQLLIKHRDVLHDLLTHFESDEVRVVLRDTQTYRLLLQESFHPDVLRNTVDREQLFDKLWADVPYRSYLTQVIPLEKKALWHQDVPLFRTCPNSRDLWLLDERITDFLPESGMTLVRRRIEQLNEQDLERQVWLIQNSLATLAMIDAQSVLNTSMNCVFEPHAKTRQCVAEVPSVEATAAQRREEKLCAFAPLREVFIPRFSNALQAACAIADRLESLALSDRQSGWIGLVNVGQSHWSVAPLGWSLFDGLPGIALFLAYLGAITQQQRYTKLAQATLLTLQHQLEYDKNLIKSIGAFDGWGGLLYTLTHLGVLWHQLEDDQNSPLLQQAVEIVELLPPLIESDEKLDIIGGAAGCIGALLSLYHCIGDERIKEVAIKCGDRILYRLKMAQETQLLTGFSHGAAGIAWALLELAALTQAERFRTAAVSAITYERSFFSVTEQNWQDLRVGQKKDTFGVAWSHGAPGIGLARLHCLKHIDDAEIRGEINAAISTTLARGFGRNHSLCNGDLGNLELLLCASQILDNSEYRSHVNRIAASLLESINQHGWLCGVRYKEVEILGLMTGIAGIGYGLLRLAAPNRVPSVLVLAPPQFNSNEISGCSTA